MNASARSGSNLNIPNALSLVRVVASPVLIILMLSPGTTTSVICAIIFVVVCATDWLDGYLARRLGMVTTLGKFLDPMADKLLVVSALVMLVDAERAPAWMVALMICREIAVTGLRAIAIEEGVVIAASAWGKLKTMSQIVAITPLLVHYTFYGIDFQAVGAVLFWIAFVLTMASGYDYFRGFFFARRDNCI